MAKGAQPGSAVACIEIGWSCRFVARGRSPGEASDRFWLHARNVHAVDLAFSSPEEKARIGDLVEALSSSSRRPRHRRATTSPGLRELEDRGQVKRWWR